MIIIKNKSMVIITLIAVTALTQFGSTVSTIPLGMFLADYWGIGKGFSAIFIAKLLPGLIMTPIYSMISSRISPGHAVTLTQILASFFMSITWLGYLENNRLLVSASFLFVQACAAYLPYVFLAYLTSTDAKKNIKNFSYWQVALSATTSFGPFLGGVLNTYKANNIAILIDIFTYIFAAITWFALTKNNNKISILENNLLSKDKIITFFIYIKKIKESRGLIMSTMYRYFAYGVINAVIPVIIINNHGSSTDKLGILFLLVSITTIISGLTLPWISGKKVNMFYIGIIETIFVGLSLLTQSIILFYFFMITKSLFMGWFGTNLKAIFMETKINDLINSSIMIEFTSNFFLMLGIVIYPLFLQNLSTNYLASIIMFIMFISLLYFKGTNNEA